ncbi:hypothetical protein [Rufibacter roseus]|uniref:Uncharacterized protein n=1 Tax=Rufibacter roseus TaxID=1567108 RepID=A0ABW2DLS0_9BACT|nr:hypothetical protein [Rufibacter roseus]
MQRRDRENQNYGDFYTNDGNSYHTSNTGNRFEVRTQDFRHQAWPERDYIRGDHQQYNDWHGRDMSRDYNHLHQYPRNNQDQHRNEQNFNRSSYQDQQHNERFSNQNPNRQNWGSDSNHDQRYTNNYSRDRDQFGNQYQDNFRHDPTLTRGGQDEDLLGNIRQGYGISSFDGTSDRFNTLNSPHRYGTQQNEQNYLSGDRDGYRSSQYGGGLGDGGFHSHRGVPDYGRGNFAENEGTGMGSSYGGKNYGGGHGYTGGHRGGTWGDSSYGSYSGNFSGTSPMGGSSYGNGRSSYGNSSQNTDRGVSELGGH